MPYLKIVEKKWIAFQMIYAVLQLHSKFFCHGDIKLESFMMTSNSSVLLTDIAPYKPAFIPQDELNLISYFFGEVVKGKSISLAPERLIKKKEYDALSNKNDLTKVSSQMDIFSLGCSICELFMEDNLFDLERLLEYKHGKRDLNSLFNIESIFSMNMSNPDSESSKSLKSLFTIVSKMLLINPTERPSINSVFQEFITNVAPISFTKMLLQINTLILSSKYWVPDLKIGLMYKHWNQIWKIILGPSEVQKMIERQVSGAQSILQLATNLNFGIINSLVLEKPVDKPFFIETLLQSSDLNHIKDEDQYLNQPELFLDKENSETILIFVNLILTSIYTCKYTSTRLVSIEMLEHFSEHMSPTDKIQILIPYITKLLEDSSNLVKIVALNSIIKFLKSISPTYILPSSDFNFYDAYVFPAIEEVIASNINKDPTIILAITNQLDVLCELEYKFLQITLHSRFEERKNSRGDINQSKIQTNVSSIHRFSAANSNFNNPLASGINIPGKHTHSTGEEFIHEYDQYSNDFRIKIFKIMEDILSENSTEIQVALIRKLPSLVLFVGRKETTNFSKFIIAQFNKKSWDIQSEILKVIPSIVLVLGSEKLNDMLISCMESIINDNLNEHKLLELVRCIKNLYAASFINNKRLIGICKNLFPLLVHPNCILRQEMIDLTTILISKLSPAEIYIYLRNALAPFLKTKYPVITLQLFQESIKTSMSRIAYECLKLKAQYNFLSLSDADVEAYDLLIGFIASNNDIFYQSEKNNYNKADFGRAPIKLNIEPCYLASKVKKEFYSFLQKYPPDDMIFIERTFLGKIISASKVLSSLQLPRRLTLLGESSICSKHVSSFYQSIVELMTHENFKLKYLFKGLEVVLSEDILTDESLNFTSRETVLKQTSIKDSVPKLISSIYSWKPQGLLLSTIYDADKGGIDKLIPLSNHLDNTFGISNNKFVSISSTSGICLYEIQSLTSDHEIGIEKLTSMKEYNADKQSAIEYKMATMIDSSSLVVGKENGKLEILKIESNKSFFKLLSTWSSKGDIGKITSILEGSKLSSEKQIFYSTSRGLIKNIDIRCASEVSSSFIGTYKGIVSCLESSSNSLIIGTYSGYLMEFDLRLNSVIKTWRYSDNHPILSIKNFVPNTSREYDCFLNSLSSYNRNKYLIVNVAAADQEIGFWNQTTMNCDLLIKVNPIQGPNITPLMTEIPCVYDEQSEKINMMLANYNNSILSKQKLNIYSINRDFYSFSNHKISKLQNIFSTTTNTAQVVYSPMCNENASYIISAGNDRVIRYWDISKDGFAKDSSYVVNTPNYMDKCNITNCSFGGTYVLQSNESYNTGIPKHQSSFSEYQNFNGLSFHLTAQNEFDASEEILKYSTKISDASHKAAVTDVTLMGVNLNSQYNNFLLSSSWDGTIKIWK